MGGPSRPRVHDPGRIASWCRDSSGALLPGYTYTPDSGGGVPCLSWRPPKNSKPDLVKCADCEVMITADRTRCRVCTSTASEARRARELKAMKEARRRKPVSGRP